MGRSISLSSLILKRFTVAPSAKQFQKKLLLMARHCLASITIVANARYIGR